MDITKLLEEAAEKSTAEAIELLEKTLNEGELQDTDQANLLYRLCGLYYEQEDVPTAVEKGEAAMTLYDQMEPSEGAVRCMRRLAVMYASQGIKEEYEKYINQAIEMAKELDLQKQLGMCYVAMGDIAVFHKEHQEALEFYQEAGGIFKPIEATEELAQVYQSIGDLLNYYSKHKAALDAYQEADKQANEAVSLSLQAAVNKKMGGIYEKLSDYETAGDCLEKAAQKLIEAKEVDAAAEMMYDAGYMMEQGKLWEKALSLYQKALPLAESIEDEMQVDTINDSIEHMQEKMAAPKSNKQSGGLFSKIKGLFGG